MEKDVKKFQELEAYINELEAKPEELIAILHRAQHIFGYLPREVQEFIADKLHINVSKVYGVVTFYSFFTMEKKGKYVIKVCDGTACHVRHSIPILEALRKELGLSEQKKTTDDLKFTVETVACLGACSSAPAITLNNEIYPTMTPESAVALVRSIKENF